MPSPHIVALLAHKGNRGLTQHAGSEKRGHANLNRNKQPKIQDSQLHRDGRSRFFTLNENLRTFEFLHVP